MKIELEITQHAYDRAKERFRWKSKSLEKMAQKAYEVGIQHSDTAGKLNKYIYKVYSQYRTANRIRIYGNVIYLFRNQMLITLYQIPSELSRYATQCKTKKSEST